MEFIFESLENIIQQRADISFVIGVSLKFPAALESDQIKRSAQIQNFIIPVKSFSSDPHFQSATDSGIASEPVFAF